MKDIARIKAQYWLDPESNKESMKAYYDHNRELILASKQARNQANPKAKRVISRKTNSRRKRNLRGRGVCMQCIPFECNMSNFYSRARDRYIECICECNHFEVVTSQLPA